MPYTFEFDCQSCKKPVGFSTALLDTQKADAKCSQCGKSYCIDDETLIRQLKQFEALCLQIRNSQEILGNASVGINVGDKHVKIPYKLLLARLTSHLDLKIGDQPLTITLRVEPLEDQSGKTIAIKRGEHG